MLHELGHILGFAHTTTKAGTGGTRIKGTPGDDAKSIMVPVIKAHVKPKFSRSDLKAIEIVYSGCR